MALVPEVSHSHHTLMMNNALVVGLADEDPPVDIPRFTLGEMMRGRDGSAYFMSNRVLGGPVTVKLQSVSITAIQWIEFFTKILKENAKINFEGAYGDSQLGLTTLLEGGKLIEAPPAIIPGVTMEFMFDFAVITPNMTGHSVPPGFVVTTTPDLRVDGESGGTEGGEGG